MKTINERLQLQLYTVSQKKTKHYSLARNFAKC